MAGGSGEVQMVPRTQSWLASQPRLTQLYCYVVRELNANGVAPAGRVVQQWIVDQLGDIQPPSRDETASILTGLIQEKAIRQTDIDKLNALRRE